MNVEKKQIKTLINTRFEWEYMYTEHKHTNATECTHTFKTVPTETLSLHDFSCCSPLYDIIECFEVLSEFGVLQVCVCVHAKSANISGLPCSCCCIQYLKKKKRFFNSPDFGRVRFDEKKYQIFVKNFHSLPQTFCTVCFLLQSSKQIIN